MPFRPAPELPREIGEQLPVTRGMFGLADGRELHFIDEGSRDAPAVVLIHGNPTWSFLWRKVIAALPDCRCVAPDLLGFGLSSRLPRYEDHTVEAHAASLVELAEALDLKRFVLVGQDWGGPLAVALGERLRDRVAGIVLGNTSVVVPDRPRGTAFHRFARVPILSDLVFRGLGFPQNVLWTAQGRRRSMLGATGRAYRWPLRRFRDRVGPLALARMVPDSVDHPSVPTLRRGQQWLQTYDGPVALVWGMRDPILARALRRHERLFPRAPVTITNAGHFLQEEVPEALADAIRDVINRGRVRGVPTSPA